MNTAAIVPDALGDPLVDVSPARAHVRELCAHSLPLRSIAQAAEISDAEAAAILGGQRQRAHLSVVLALLDVDYRPRPTQTSVLAIGAVRRTLALPASGWPLATVARCANIAPASLPHLTDSTTTSYGRWRALAHVFAVLAPHPGPSDAARRHAREHGWPPPPAWPPDRIDDPDAQPLPRAEWRTPAVDRRIVDQAEAGHIPWCHLAERERDATVVRMVAAGLATDWIAHVLHTDAAAILRWRNKLRLPERNGG